MDDKKLTLHGLRQFVMKVSENTKNRYLTEIMDNSEFNQLVIYTSSNVRAKALQKLMNSWCFPCLAITSNMPTEERMRHFIAFKERKTPILITTDLFGRGVDVEKVNMVINYDFPATSEHIYIGLGERDDLEPVESQYPLWPVLKMKRCWETWRVGLRRRCILYRNRLLKNLGMLSIVFVDLGVDIGDC